MGNESQMTLKKMISQVMGTISFKDHEILLKDGQNCGQHGADEAMVVDSLSMPDTIVLGDNNTFAAGFTVNKKWETATLLSVKMVKIFGSMSWEIPCMGGQGSCDYYYPCKKLEKVECPAEVVAKGWNCRCPIPVNSYSFGPVTKQLDKPSFPAMFVNGDYNMNIRLFDGTDELMCYKFSMKVKV